jgi:hypothetical protein
MISDKLLSGSGRRLENNDQKKEPKGIFGNMFEAIPSILILAGLFAKSMLDVTSLFDFAAGLVAFFFVIVCVLIFIFVYDNLRRQKRTTSATVP